MSSPDDGRPADPESDVPQQSEVASFRFWFATGHWEWSPQLYRLHGYRPGEIEPTTELLLAHKHPDDRAHVAETLARCLEQGLPFSSRHRFLDTAGVEHSVIVVADTLADATGQPVGTTGFYLDLSDTVAEVERQTLASRLPEVIESRVAIEQAKGVIMRMYNISAEQAFKVLVWRSQETNTKLRALADEIMAELPQVPPPPPPTVAAFDHILLTAHLRIPHN